MYSIFLLDDRKYNLGEIEFMLKSDGRFDVTSLLWKEGKMDEIVEKATKKSFDLYLLDTLLNIPTEQREFTWNIRSVKFAKQLLAKDPTIGERILFYTLEANEHNSERLKTEIERCKAIFFESKAIFRINKISKEKSHYYDDTFYVQQRMKYLDYIYKCCIRAY